MTREGGRLMSAFAKGLIKQANQRARDAKRLSNPVAKLDLYTQANALMGVAIIAQDLAIEEYLHP